MLPLTWEAPPATQPRTAGTSAVAMPAAMQPAEAMTAAQERIEQSSAWAAKTSCAEVTLGALEVKNVSLYSSSTQCQGCDVLVSACLWTMALLGAATAAVARAAVTRPVKCMLTGLGDNWLIL